MNSAPKITIVTVTYNCVDTVEKTIRNVLKQTYPNIEYIVIDGASTDGTREVIERYADRLAYWISEPDKGIYDAMNKGIKAATGEWILFRNSGDYFFKPTTVEDVFNWYEDKGEDLITGTTRMFEHDGYYDFCYAPSSDEPWDRARFSHPATFIRCQTQKQILFPNELRIAGDFYLFCKMMIAKKTYSYYPGIIALFNNGDGLSYRNRIQSAKEQIKVVKMLGGSNETLSALKKHYLRTRLLSTPLRIIKKIPQLNYIYRKKTYKHWTFMPEEEILSNI